MNDEFETRVGTWMRDRARPDPASLASVLGSIDTLPERRGRRRRGWLLATAAVVAVVAVGASAFMFASRPDGYAPSGPNRPVPPDPAAFAGDPRLAACFGSAGPVEFAFEMRHARDYQRHLPAMLLSPELDVDDPGFVVVFASGAELPVGGGAFASRDTTSPNPNQRSVCILVGGVPNLYEHVDISGMGADIGTGDATASLQPSPTTSPSAGPAPTPTVAPAPAWTGDLLAQLECQGDPQLIGGEVGEISTGGRTGTASPYPWLYALDAEDMPLEGWVEAPKVDWESGDSKFVRYVNEVEGRVVAIIVMHVIVGDWSVAGYRACAAAEFDPLRGRSTDDAPWLDPAGLVSGVRTIVGPAHCGWQSTVWMFIDDKNLFLRDPTGIFADVEVGAYLPDTSLPSDAHDTGLTSHGRRLFTVPDGSAVFVKTSTAVERWPRSTDPLIGCA